jgi:uncharacterized protein
MTRFATGLAARGINVVTFNFLYTEQGRRVPDANKALEACFRAVIEAVRHKKIGRGRLVIGGKSMGGRIAFQVAAASAPGVEGPSSSAIRFIPLVTQTSFVRSICRISQFRCCSFKGSRDAFGSPDELRPMIKELKAPADLYVVEGGEHSFRILKRAGVTQEDAYKAVLDQIELWLRQSFAN